MCIRDRTRAVIEAAIEVKQECGYDIVPEIMIPLVGEVKELKYVKDIVVKTAEEVMKEKGVTLKYMVGTMIEIPRAAITADEIAQEAEFFSCLLYTSRRGQSPLVCVAGRGKLCPERRQGSPERLFLFCRQAAGYSGVAPGDAALRALRLSLIHI